ncbi:MAG: hypothetical protein V3U97_04755 [bacterium]
MTKLTQLPNWKNLKKEEKARLKEIVGKEDVGGQKSISAKELKKGKENIEK